VSVSARIDPERLAREVAARVGRELELLLDDLRDWVDQDSPTLDAPLVDALALVLAERCAAYGLQTELLDLGGNGRYLHAWLTGPGRARVALLCHHDSVFAAGTGAARPFSRDDENVYGPGVCDMKGGIAVALHAMRILGEGTRPFERLELISVPDEEEREGPPLSLERLRGFDAVLCMECGRESHAIVSSRKGGRWLRLNAHGTAAHAGVAPQDGRNALTALVAEAARMAQINHARPGLTAEPTVLHAGDSINTVPDHASMIIDLRALTEADLEWALETMNDVGDHPDIRFSSELIGWTPPMERTPEVAALARAAVAFSEALGLPGGEESTGGVSDGSWAAGLGVPTLDGMGPTGGRDHTADEYAVIRTFAVRCGIIAGLVAMIDNGDWDASSAPAKRL
jgi:glutamate carboxypeptidase